VVNNLELRPYFITDEEYRETREKRNYEWLKPYYEKSEYNHVDKTVEELEKERKERAKFFTERDFANRFFDSTTLWVFMSDGTKFPIKNLGKYKDLTEKFLLEKIESNHKKFTSSKFADFIKKVSKLLEENKIKNFWIYPTTYGIGVWSFYNYHAKENAESVRKILESLNVEFRNEWSDALWVYRFVISKNKKNLSKLA
jgi:hypothetical protein